MWGSDLRGFGLKGFGLGIGIRIGDATVPEETGSSCRGLTCIMFQKLCVVEVNCILFEM